MCVLYRCDDHRLLRLNVTPVRTAFYGQISNYIVAWGGIGCVCVRERESARARVCIMIHKRRAKQAEQRRSHSH